MLALGLIETRGLVPAIEGADAMLKAADVRLLEKHFVGGGLVTITIAGEVSAVRAAVDAAVAAIRRIEGATLLSEHVIARPDEELTRILCFEPAEEKSAPCQVPDKAPAPNAPPDALAPDSPAPDEARLKSMGLNRLRQLARSMEALSLSPEEVATADKKSLITAICNAFKQIKE